MTVDSGSDKNANHNDNNYNDGDNYYNDEQVDDSYDYEDYSKDTVIKRRIISSLIH